MKKRILSFVLVLIMVISAMPLWLFSALAETTPVADTTFETDAGGSITKTIDTTDLQNQKVKVSFSFAQNGTSNGGASDGAVLKINGQRTIRVTSGSGLHVFTSESPYYVSGTQTWNYAGANYPSNPVATTLLFDVAGGKVDISYVVNSTTYSATLTGFDFSSAITLGFGGADAPQIKITDYAYETFESMSVKLMSDGNLISESAVIKGEQFDLPYDTMKTGYHLVGWTDGLNIYDRKESVTIYKDKTFTAVWEEGQGYIVNFKCGANYNVYDQYASPVVMPTPSSFNGSVMSGWKDNDKNMHQVGDAVEISGATTFTAVYVKTVFEVPFLYFNGTAFETVATKTTTSASSKLTTPSAPEKSGYTFKGWTRDFVTFVNAETEIDAGGNNNPYYAVFEHTSSHSYQTYVRPADCMNGERTYSICECGAMETYATDDVKKILTFKVTGEVVGHSFSAYTLSQDEKHQTRECTVCGITETKKVAVISNTTNLLAIGDSITFGQKVTSYRENSYAKYLADELLLNYVNLAVSGTRLCAWRSVLTQSNNHNQWMDNHAGGVTYEMMTSNIQKAGLIVMTLSTNDLLFDGASADIETRMYEFIDEIHRINPDAIVVVVNFAYMSSFWNNADTRFGIGSCYAKYLMQQIELNERYTKGFAQDKYDYVYYVDTSDTISTFSSYSTEITGNPDGVHPGKTAYRSFVDDIVSALGNVSVGAPTTTYDVNFYNSDNSFVETQNAYGVFTLPSAPTALITDAVFKGWTNDGGLTLYKAGEEISVKGNMSFTAVWRTPDTAKSYTYNISDLSNIETFLQEFTGGYSVVGNVATHSYSDRYKYSVEKDVNFMGNKAVKMTSIINTNAAGNTTGQAIKLPTFDTLDIEDMQYIAITYYYNGIDSTTNANVKWQLSFTVNSQGFTVESDNVAVEDGAAVIKFNLANMSGNFENFIGMPITALSLKFYNGSHIKDKAGAEYYFVNLTLSNRSGEATPIVASYLDENDESLGSDNANYGILTVRSEREEISGYRFKGYKYGNEVAVADSTIILSEDTTLKAYYKLIETYNVSFVSDGNTVYSTTTTDTVTAPAAQTKFEHAFLGWSDGVKLYQPGESIEITEDNKVINAVFEARTYYNVVYKDANGNTVKTYRVESGTTHKVQIHSVSLGKATVSYNNGTKDISLGTEIAVNGDITLTPNESDKLENYTNDSGYTTLANSLYKLYNGQKLTVGIVGDSIGYGQIPGGIGDLEGVNYNTKYATGSKNPMAYPRVFSDWFDYYVESELEIDNADIDYYYSVWGGATLRTVMGYLEEDILGYNPDLFIIEIWNAIERNHVNTAWLESIVQMIYAKNPYADIIFLDVGNEFSYGEHTAIAQKYGIPFIRADKITKSWFSNANTFGTASVVSSNLYAPDANGSIQGTRGYYYNNGSPHVNEECYQYWNYLMGDTVKQLVALAKLGSTYGTYSYAQPATRRITMDGDTVVYPTDTCEPVANLILHATDVTADEMTASGSWTLSGTVDRTAPLDSADRASASKLTPSAVGDSVTVTFNGCGFMVRGNGSFTYSIDGGEAQDLSIGVYVELGTTDAEHTVVITCTNTSKAYLQEIYEYSHAYKAVSNYENVKDRNVVAYYAKMGDAYIHNGLRNGGAILPAYLTYYNLKRVDTWGDEIHTVLNSSIIFSTCETKGAFVGWMEADEISYQNGEKIPTVSPFYYTKDGSGNITGATYVDGGANKKIYFAGEEINPEGNTLNLVAVYKNSAADSVAFNITYKDGENTVGNDSTYGQITVKDALSKEGYVFVGWSNGTATYKAGAVLDVSESTEKAITFNAVWRNLSETPKKVYNVSEIILSSFEALVNYSTYSYNYSLDTYNANHINRYEHKLTRNVIFDGKNVAEILGVNMPGAGSGTPAIKFADTGLTLNDAKYILIEYYLSSASNNTCAGQTMKINFYVNGVKYTVSATETIVKGEWKTAQFNLCDALDVATLGDYEITNITFEFTGNISGSFKAIIPEGASMNLSTVSFSSVNPNFTATFDENGGSDVENITTKGALTLPEITYAGHVFLGWSSDNGLTFKQAGANITIFEDTTFKAFFREFEVKFYDLSELYTTINGTESVIAPECTLEKDGETFVGWKLGDTVYEVGDTIEITGDTTLTAVFKGAYSATFMNGDTEVKVISEVKSFIIPEIEVSNPGHNLIGWKLGDTTYEVGDTVVLSKSETLDAVWEVDYIDAIFKDGETVIDTVSVPTSDDDIVVIPSITKDGYTFKGFVSNGTVYMSGDKIKLTGDTVFTALFVENTDIEKTVLSLPEIFYSTKNMDFVYGIGTQSYDSATGTWTFSTGRGFQRHSIQKTDAIDGIDALKIKFIQSGNANEFMTFRKTGLNIPVANAKKITLKVYFEGNGGLDGNRVQLIMFTDHSNQGAYGKYVLYSNETLKSGQWNTLTFNIENAYKDGSGYNAFPYDKVLDCNITGFDFRWYELTSITSGAGQPKLTVGDTFYFTDLVFSNEYSIGNEVKFVDGNDILSVSNTKDKVKLPTAPTSELTFKGWRYGETLYSAGEVISIDKDAIISAEWAGTYRATFKNGENTVATIEDVNSITIPNLTVVAQNGYKLIGWTADGGENVYAVGDNLVLAEDTVLEAVFAPITHKVVLTDGTTVLQTIENVRELDYFEFPKTTNKEGYIFVGWTEGAEMYFEGDKIHLSGDTTFKAIYEDFATYEKLHLHLNDVLTTVEGALTGFKSASTYSDGVETADSGTSRYKYSLTRNQTYDGVDTLKLCCEYFSMGYDNTNTNINIPISNGLIFDDAMRITLSYFFVSGENQAVNQSIVGNYAKLTITTVNSSSKTYTYVLNSTNTFVEGQWDDLIFEFNSKINNLNRAEVITKIQLNWCSTGLEAKKGDTLYLADMTFSDYVEKNDTKLVIFSNDSTNLYGTRANETLTMPEVPEGKTVWTDGTNYYAVNSKLSTTKNYTLEAVDLSFYNVSISDGENTVDAHVVQNGETFTAPAAITKDRKNFVNWSDGVNTYNPGDIITVNKDITLTAIFVDKVYKNVYINDGQNLIDTVEVEVGDTYTVPAAITKDRKNFVNWSDGVNNYNPGDEITVNENITLTAIFVDKVYKNVYINDGTSVIDTVEIEEGTNYTAPQAISKTGYAFLSWSDGTNNYNPLDEITVNDNITLTAIWGELYHVVVKDGETTLIDEEVVSEITLPSVRNLDGYVFVGYSDGTTVYQAGTNLVITGDITLNAVRRSTSQGAVLNLANEVCVGTTFLRNGSGLLVNGNGYKIEKTTYENQNVMVISSYDDHSGASNSGMGFKIGNVNVKVGDTPYITLTYKFERANESQASSTEGKQMMLIFKVKNTDSKDVFGSRNTFMIMGDETISNDGWRTIVFDMNNLLNAAYGQVVGTAYDYSQIADRYFDSFELQWTSTLNRFDYTNLYGKNGEKIYISTMGFTKVNPVKSVTFDENGGSDVEDTTTKNTVTLPEISYAGHLFLGWSKDNGTTLLPSGTVVAITEDTAFKAFFREFEVKFYDLSELYTTLNGTESVIAPECTIVKDGETFVGWKLGDTVYEVGDTIEITGDTTLTAVFKGAYSATFMNGDTEVEVISDVKSFVVPELDVSNLGYKLVGWKLGDTTYKVGETVVLTENAILYADWEVDMLDATFKDGDTVIETVSVYTSEDDIEVLPARIKQGYTFIGWSDGSSIFKASDTIHITDDTVFTAVYAIDSELTKTTLNSKDLFFSSTSSTSFVNFDTPTFDEITNTWTSSMKGGATVFNFSSATKDGIDTYKIYIDKINTSGWYSYYLKASGLNVPLEKAQVITLKVYYENSNSSNGNRMQLILVTNASTSSNYNKIAIDSNESLVPGWNTLTFELKNARDYGKDTAKDCSGMLSNNVTEINLYIHEHTTISALNGNVKAKAGESFYLADFTLAKYDTSSNLVTLNDGGTVFGKAYTMGKVKLPSALTDDNFEFLGYRIENTVYDAETTVSVSQDTLVSSAWAGIYSAKFKDGSTIYGSYTQINDIVVPNFDVSVPNGYRFIGWSNDGGDTLYNAGDYIDLSGLEVFEAQFELITHSAIFKNGEETVKSVESQSEIEYLVIPNALVKEGYVFMGYQSGDTVYKSGEKIYLTGDTTFEAVFVLDSTVKTETFNLPTIFYNTENMDFGNSITEPTYDAETGVWTFKSNRGWQKYSLAKDSSKGVEALKIVTVTNGNANEGYSFQKSGLNIPIADASKLQLKVYFEGYGGADGGKVSIIITTDNTNASYQKFVLYSNETLKNGQWNTLTFNLENAIWYGSNMNPFSYSKVLENNITAFDFRWFTFNGRSDAGQPQIRVGDTFYFTDLIMSNNYHADYTLTLKNGSDVVAKAETNDKVVLPALPQDKNAWSDGTNYYEAGAVISLTKNTVLNAVNNTTYKVSLSDGTSEIDSTILVYESEYTVANAIRKQGKVFVKWTDGVNDYNPGDKITVVDNVNLTAVFRDAVQKTVSVSDGNGLSIDFKVYELDSFVLPQNTFLANTKYTQFRYWYDGVNYYLPGDSVEITDDTTFTAYFGQYQYSGTAINFNGLFKNVDSGFKNANFEIIANTVKDGRNTMKLNVKASFNRSGWENGEGIILNIPSIDISQNRYVVIEYYYEAPSNAYMIGKKPALVLSNIHTNNGNNFEVYAYSETTVVANTWSTLVFDLTKLSNCRSTTILEDLSVLKTNILTSATLIWHATESSGGYQGTLNESAGNAYFFGDVTFTNNISLNSPKIVDGETVRYITTDGNTVKLPMLKDVDGYNSFGWIVDSATEYATEGSTVSITDESVITAYRLKKPHVIVMNEETKVDEQNYDLTTEYTLPNAQTKDGYNFIGWSDGKTVYSAGAKVEIITEITFNAVFELIPHSHTAVVDRGYAATCYSAGLTDGSHCSECEEVIVAQQVIPQLTHNFIDNVCSHCGLVQKQVVIDPEHPEEKIDVTVLPDEEKTATAVDKGEYTDALQEKNVKVKLEGIKNAIVNEFMQQLINSASALATVENENIKINVKAKAEVKNVVSVDTTIKRVKYDVKPIAEFIKDDDVATEVAISNDKLNGNAITLVISTAGMIPSQIIHTRENGTNEYFYPENSGKAKTFTYDEESETVTLQISSFSEIELLYEEIGEANFVGSMLTLGDAIALRTFVDLSGYTSEEIARMVVDYEIGFAESLLNKTVSVQSTKYGEYYEFRCGGITPQCLADTIKATLKLDGEVIAAYNDFTIIGYLETVYQDSKTSAEMKAFVSSLYTYGKAAKAYAKYDVENPIESTVIPEIDLSSDVISTNPNESVNKFSTSANANVKVDAANIIYGSYTYIVLRLNGNDIDYDKIKVKVGEEEKSISIDNGIIKLWGLKATEITSIFDLDLYYDNVKIQTVHYGVGSYVYSKQNSTSLNDAYKALVKAVYAYGVRADALE